MQLITRSLSSAWPSCFFLINFILRMIRNSASVSKGLYTSSSLRIFVYPIRAFITIITTRSIDWKCSKLYVLLVFPHVFADQQDGIRQSNYQSNWQFIDDQSKSIQRRKDCLHVRSEEHWSHCLPSAARWRHNLVLHFYRYRLAMLEALFSNNYVSIIRVDVEFR